MKIAIIGGGVMGLASAWRLAHSGADVTLFEARTLGQGATLAALGALWPATPLATGPLQELHRESLWEFEGFIRAIEAASGSFIDFRRLGRLTLLAKTDSLKRAAAEATAACERWPRFAARPTMEVLDAQDIAREFPSLANTRGHAVRCRATAQVNIPQLVAALSLACQRAGVQIREHTPIAMDCRDGRLAAFDAQSLPIQADVFLITAGAWSATLSPQLAAVAPVRPVKGQGIRLAIPGGLLPTIIKCDSIYAIPWNDELLVGATTEPQAAFDETPTDAARHMLYAAAVDMIPALANAKIIAHWAGLRPQNAAKGHAPIMGPHPTIPNLFLCTGHYKTGIGMAPRASALMRDLILAPAAPPAQLAPFFPKISM